MELHYRTTAVSELIYAQPLTAVALEPQTDLVQLLAIQFDVCFHIVEIEPEATRTKRTAWTSRPRRCWRCRSRVARLALGSGVRSASGCWRTTWKSAARRRRAKARKTSGRWLHRFPVLGRDLQMNLPNASQPKHALRFVLRWGLRFVRSKTWQRQRPDEQADQQHGRRARTDFVHFRGFRHVFVRRAADENLT